MNRECKHMHGRSGMCMLLGLSLSLSLSRHPTDSFYHRPLCRQDSVHQYAEGQGWVVRLSCAGGQGGGPSAEGRPCRACGTGQNNSSLTVLFVFTNVAVGEVPCLVVLRLSRPCFVLACCICYVVICSVSRGVLWFVSGG